MDRKPTIKESKTRLNLLMEKEHKQHLEKVAYNLGLSLNSLFVSTVLEKYPMKKD